MAHRPSPLTTWCRLLRLPNLFTVPGDPLAGFMLATGGVLDWRVAGAMATSLLLYSAGLLLNDYFDREVDARERPDRPIPSGAVSAPTVVMAGALLLIAGVLAARAVGGESASWAAALVAACVLGYDGALKHRRVIGPIVMGACRGGSVLIGAACSGGLDTMSKVFGGWIPQGFTPWHQGARGATAALIAAVTACAYTAMVTVIARNEAGAKRAGRAAYLPGLTLLAGGVAMLRCSMGNVRWPLMSGVCAEGGGGTHWFVDWAGVAAVVLLAVALAETQLAAAGVRRGRLPVPAFVGRLVRVMITVQAAWCAWTLGPLLGRGASRPWSELLIVAIAWLVVRWGAGFASRRFYGS